MKKLVGWQTLLHHYLSENKNREFAWGDWDCCTFANGAIKAITGSSVLPPELSWQNESEAMEAIHSYGRTFANAIKMACRAAGLEPIDVQHITAGDICVYMNDNEELCGICDGFTLISPADQGYAFTKCDAARLAWRVPEWKQ